ncbi:hypothetical protein NY08_4525 [Rhodococcus sp. B7740]|nr:hypothetical protein NY08_4525 [Rhodococcus sp. B7740]
MVAALIEDPFRIGRNRESPRVWTAVSVAGCAEAERCPRGSAVP